MNWKKEHHAEQSFNERHPQQGIAIDGTMEIEYVGESDFLFVSIDCKVTISYKVWSIDEEGAECEYKIVGSANYLPSDFDQLVIDYIKELEVMNNVSIYKITRV